MLQSLGKLFRMHLRCYWGSALPVDARENELYKKLLGWGYIFCCSFPEGCRWWFCYKIVLYWSRKFANWKREISVFWQDPVNSCYSLPQNMQRNQKKSKLRNKLLGPHFILNYKYVAITEVQRSLLLHRL